ncbi:hypothetical protein [Amnibacterium endophyticum]|uniref:Uncharacterized protein n=1 Tax=Amnibacterium endophyticum TaxID=2109337 RepID=A0ABW4LF67_9MICO
MANEIKDIDRQLNELDDRVRESVRWGLHGSGAGAGALGRDRAQQEDDQARTSLEQRRRALAEELRASVAQSQK